MTTFWIGVGGALGSIARYHLDTRLQHRFGPAFPYGTLAVNLLGSFLIALLLHVGARSDLIPPTLRIALATGVLGGFTTYSTFNYETLRYFQDGAWAVGAINIALTLVSCLVAGLLGWACGRALVGA